MQENFIDYKFTKETLQRISQFEGHQIFFSHPFVTAKNFNPRRKIEVDGKEIYEFNLEIIQDMETLEELCAEDNKIYQTIKTKIEEALNNG